MTVIMTETEKREFDLTYSIIDGLWMDIYNREVEIESFLRNDRIADARWEERMINEDHLELQKYKKEGWIIDE